MGHEVWHIAWGSFGALLRCLCTLFSRKRSVARFACIRSVTTGAATVVTNPWTPFREASASKLTRLHGVLVKGRLLLVTIMLQPILARARNIYNFYLNLVGCLRKVPSYWNVMLSHRMVAMRFAWIQDACCVKSNCEWNLPVQRRQFQWWWPGVQLHDIATCYCARR